MCEDRGVPTTPTGSRLRPDAVLARAVEQARAAALEMAEAADVGEPVGCLAEGERVVTHQFACTRRGYRGWRWSVTLARAPRQRHGTVDEVVLLPGDDSVVAPVWLPWSERLRPGDLGPGDVLPVDDDDPRLVAGWFAADPATDPLVDESTGGGVATEVGLGRERVLSLEGRDAAATRWYDGERGPAAPTAAAAPGRCVSCGFLVRLGGALGTLFGVCANGNVGDDGNVVSFDHGCGGHSDVREARPTGESALPEPVFDTVAYEPFSFD
ncbi:MAG: DUF3027 domain-containing protein [Nocardioidaceae bacterium]|nr:DUF3027 domain-containing protein [Nocardioidaceae bacterium]